MKDTAKYSNDFILRQLEKIQTPSILFVDDGKSYIASDLIDEIKKSTDLGKKFIKSFQNIPSICFY